jgi:hypothetical protein
VDKVPLRINVDLYQSTRKSGTSNTIESSKLKSPMTKYNISDVKIKGNSPKVEFKDFLSNSKKDLKFIKTEGINGLRKSLKSQDFQTIKYQK